MASTGRRSPKASVAREATSSRRPQRRASGRSAKFRNLLRLAETQGLLEGSRDILVRGRMPKALVQKAKSRVGIHSDTKLIELALANLAVADDYAEWLLSRRGVIPQDIDLGF